MAFSNRDLSWRILVKPAVSTNLEGKKEKKEIKELKERREEGKLGNTENKERRMRVVVPVTRN